jgi:5-methyltetrahydropteroyltriglutamate--homocysteine methyltransferase
VEHGGSVKRSTDRILTTHVGSLPRPVDLLEMNDAKGSGRSIDQSAWAARVKTAVFEIVRLQRECGVDIVNDGELSKSSWSSYVNERLSGFAESVSQGRGSLAKGRDKRTFQNSTTSTTESSPSEPSMAHAGPT